MPLSRRIFLAGAAGSMAASAAATIIAPDASPAQRRALDAIAAYLEAHRRHFGLPALGLVVVDGAQSFTILSGTRDYRASLPLTGDELWQIGSISKSFIALVCLQLQAEGKLNLDDELREHLPEARLPGISSGGPFTIRGLLNHTTGLPDFAPPLPADGSRLWRGFPAGSHWSYSNTGYNLIGLMLERIEGKPLYQIIENRVARPLGMTATRGAIQWQDRARYPASYAPLRADLPVVRGMALAPAPWGDMNGGAGCVASTLADMAKYLRFLISCGRNRGEPLLTAGQAGLWLGEQVVQDADAPKETYGMGLMHRWDDGRSLLHHTGGMICFSSSFHVDAEAGTGAFASCAVGGLNYRPRLITAYAAKAMRLARPGAALPPPPALVTPLANAADFNGRFGDGKDMFSVEAGLLVRQGSSTAVLEPVAPDLFVTSLPLLGSFPLQAVRVDGKVVAFDMGSRRFEREGVATPLPARPLALMARAGHYQSDDPWAGGFTLVARGDGLFLGGIDRLVEIDDDVWKLAEPAWHPERLKFTGFVNGIPQVAVFSGRTYERRDF